MKNKILTVGSIAIDELHTPKGSEKNILGGSATFFSIAAAKYSPVKLIGIVGDDFPKEGWNLFHKYNINTELVTIKKGETFNWGGKYSNDYSKRETLYTNLGVFENFSPNVPPLIDTEYLYLGNIQPSLQLDVINKVKNKKRIVSDTMNLWIDLDVDGLWSVIKKSDIFLLNDEEAMELTNKTDLNEITKILLDAGPEIVIIKKGSKGALLAQNDNTIDIPVYDKINLFDPTGAGDSFAGGLVGYFSKYGENNLEDALIHATVTASYTVSDFGVKGLISSSEDSFEKRCKYLKTKI
ncbi:PfkB family carbohydrate kinase [Candidatus Marinimicrobia bacterium]|nr:PfkB family carbohydrate kinase [Candidatus Neomarinimicrobiota bacterium]